MMRLVIATLVSALTLSGCIGWKNKVETAAAKNACIDAGYTVDHPQHHECISNTIPVIQRQSQTEAQQAIAGGLVAGAVYAGGYYAGKADGQEHAGRSQIANEPANQQAPFITKQYKVDGHWYCQYSNGSTVVMPTMAMCNPAYGQ